MLAWLRAGPLTEDGAILSWTNATHPGYAYPEAAGLWLGLFAEEGTPGDAEHRVADALIKGMAPDGSVGRRGFAYPFDTAVALRGLLAFERAGGRISDFGALERMFGYIATSVAARSAVHPEIAEDRWSTRYNPHLLKLVIVCSEWHSRTGDARCRDVSAQLQRELQPKALEWLEGSTPRYSHSVCYATEAMIHLAKADQPGSREGAERAAEWLARIQDPSGGIPAWSQPGLEARLASDATAQAVGIWAAVDADGHAARIFRALSHLARVQDESGGIRYSERGADVNTWCTIFALDALRAVAKNRS